VFPDEPQADSASDHSRTAATAENGAESDGRSRIFENGCGRRTRRGV